MKDEEQNITQSVFKYVGLSILGLVLLFVIFGSFYTIPAGYRGVVLTWGNPTMIPVTEGLHFKIPIAQSIIKIDTKTQKYEADLTAASKDLQDVNTKVAINYHLVPENVPNLYKTIGIDYSNKVIYPAEQDANKAVTSQYNAEQLITQREEVRDKMETLLKSKLQDRGIIIESINIVNFKFSDSFTQAIEQKVTAEQNALTAENNLKAMQYNAQAMELQKQVIEIKKLDIQQKWIEKWNGILPTQLIANGGTVDMLLSLPTIGNK